VHVLAALIALGSLMVPPQQVEPRGDLVAASAILHAWDARREAAWAASDTRALRSLYLRGSTAGAADVRLLRAYGDRGLVVRRIVTQVFALRVLRRDSTHLTVWVVDRVAGGVVDDGRRTAPLGTTKPVLRVVVLSRVAHGWRVAQVSARGQAPRRAPPGRRGRGR
jgi:hypothetical protein